MNKLIELSQCSIYNISGRTIGATGDLVNADASSVLGTMLDDIEKLIRYVCYPEYSLTID